MVRAASVAHPCLGMEARCSVMWRAGLRWCVGKMVVVLGGNEGGGWVRDGGVGWRGGAEDARVRFTDHTRNHPSHALENGSDVLQHL